MENILIRDEKLIDSLNLIRWKSSPHPEQVSTSPINGVYWEKSFILWYVGFIRSSSLRFCRPGFYYRIKCSHVPSMVLSAIIRYRTMFLMPQITNLRLWEIHEWLQHRGLMAVNAGIKIKLCLSMLAFFHIKHCYHTIFILPRS